MKNQKSSSVRLKYANRRPGLHKHSTKSLPVARKYPPVADSRVIENLPIVRIVRSAHNKPQASESNEGNANAKANLADFTSLNYLRQGRRTGTRGIRGTAGIFSTRSPPTPSEVKFLEAAEYGDIPTVRKTLDGSTTINVNCVDYMGQNALQLAVGNEHLEVVEILLKQPNMSRIGDALLLAISKGYVRIAECILNHPEFKVHDRLTRSPNEQRLLNKDNDFYAYDEDGTRFSPDITPIILAAQYQEVEVIHELLERGARIVRPHPYNCLCEDCSFKRKLDSFSHSLSRLNAYKGLASPAYLSLSSTDPVLMALELSHELHILSSVEKEFKKDYYKLSKQCHDFVERLLDLCRDTEEVAVILNGDVESTQGKDGQIDDQNDGGSGRKSFEDIETTFANSDFRNNGTNVQDGRKSCNNDAKLERLRIAIRYKVKGFVAHPNCQQQLLRIWHRNIAWLWSSPRYYQIAFGFIVCFFMPVLAFMYIIAPGFKIMLPMRSPFFKFVAHAMSYAQFVFLLIVNASDRFEWYNFPTWFLVHQTKPEGRYCVFTWCEVIIMAYILGFLWNECKELWDEGPREYLFQLWNIIDFFMLSIFISSFTLRAVSYYKVSQGQHYWDEHFGNNSIYAVYDIDKGIGCYNHSCQKVPFWAGYYAYTRADRKYWHGFDPQLISEALFSYGIVLSFSRIAYILPANEYFGPLQISLGKTVGDIVKWLVIFSMIFGAFMLGLFNLYSYYRNGGGKKSFTTVEETFITLFWTMFGLADYQGVELSYNHQLTRVVGYQLYGTYNIISVIVMLNMLIAMINSSYSEIEQDSDVEWKFARAKLWMSYFDDGKTLPVPYNIIPSLKSVINMSKKLYQLMRRICRCRKNNYTPEINEMKLRRNMTESFNLSSVTTAENGHHMKRSATLSSAEEAILSWNTMSKKCKKENLSRYQVVMRRIVKRFVIKAQVEKNKDEINEGELQEIKHDISSLRYELLESDKKQLETIFKLLQGSGAVSNETERSSMNENVNTKSKSEWKAADVLLNNQTNSKKVLETDQNIAKPQTTQIWGKPRSAVVQREIRRTQKSTKGLSPRPSISVRISGVFHDNISQNQLEDLAEEKPEQEKEDLLLNLPNKH